MIGKYRWLAVLAMLPLAAAAAAPESPLKACRAERDDVRRLACYDREIDRLDDAPAAAAAPAPAETPALTAEERFGRVGKMEREEKDRKREEARQGELTAKVTETWTRSDGLISVTLDNGQVWTQNRPDSFFRIKVGDQVKIEPASLGSFLLSGPSKRSTRVTRTK